jgi:hypothetical protein
MENAVATLYCDTYKREPVEQATFDRARDLAAELTVEMAKDLGYAFDHTLIKDNAYLPKLHGGHGNPTDAALGQGR